MTLDEVAERLMRMDPTRPGVGRLAQELVAAVGGLAVKPDRWGVASMYGPGRYRKHPIPRVMT